VPAAPIQGIRRTIERGLFEFPGEALRSRLCANGVLAAVCPALIVIANVDVASAQETSAEDRIIVTARRREESFQDVPVAITAFTADDISAAGIERTQDFINLTPNVTLVQTQNQGTSFLTMRGVSQARNSEPSAAIIVDGVLLTNPAQLNQELFDIQRVEVLKGPQGAIFGRNAIGGAILITTREPGDEHEARVRLGYDSGPGFRAQVSSGGPLGDSDSLKYQAALSYFDTDGYIENVHLGEEADPFKDTSVRFRLTGEPNDRLRWDARVYNSEVETQALYYRIGADDDVNNTSYRVRVNNTGINNRDLTQLSFKLDYDTDFGTFTSITSFDTIEEILTGDQYDFVPEEDSLFYLLGQFGVPGFGLYDWAQAQYLDVDSISQEIRFTSPGEDRFRWIAGAYVVQTDRYISTSNITDPLGGGNEAYPVYRTPLSNQISFLADSQDNFAWALFGEVATDLSDALELSVALRYDEDTRENTTLTPDSFLFLIPEAFQGEVREQTWDELQPRITLRYQPSSKPTLTTHWPKRNSLCRWVESSASSAVLSQDRLTAARSSNL
jgi:iron complex outermembrane receptor protein